MKIALQISGRLRFTTESIGSLIGAIIEPLQPDIFCSFWQPENSNTIDDYIKYINPSMIDIENHTIVKPYLDELFPFNLHTNMPSMSYKFYKVSQLRQTWELQHRIKYDVVIQARSDNVFFEKLDLARCQLSIDNHAILCANQGYNQSIDDYVPRPRMVDNFYLGPGDLMNKANETFWSIRKQAQEYTNANMLHHVRIPEIIQTKIWQDSKITINGLPGTGDVGNFWYDIDRTETKWR